MNKSFSKKIFTVLGVVFSLLIIEDMHATHIRAGEITAVRISNTSLTYEFSIIGYTDTGSDVTFGGQGSGEINFGDGTIVSLLENAHFSQTTIIGDEIAFNIIKINHTFQAPGKYTISYNERNRNAGIQNMSNSVDTPFFVETEILIDPFLGINNTPIFLVPPVDQAAVGAIFIHNPGAFDIDGDSLSYGLVIPKQSVGTEVFDYLPVNHPDFYPDGFALANEAQNGPPTFEIDEISGDLIWDAPGLMGEYNAAFIVREWRKVQGEWFQLGSVTRDMQIIVEETDNERPEVVIPDEICVEAGTTISEEITGLDPDGHDVKLEAFGGPLEFSTNAAVFTPDPPVFQPQPGTLDFTWTTNCDQVRERPYEVQFKVTDNPPLGPKLVDFKTLPIRIVGSAPTGLTVNVIDGKTIRLDWDTYDCGSANQMQIWRRVDSFNFVPEECQIGLPDFAGYEMIAILDSIKYLDENDNLQFRTSFTDNNGGVGLSPGANYCYRIVAQFPEPAGGESYASEEACQIIRADVPVVLNVDIRRTDETDGEIYVRWMNPFEVDRIQFPPPYTYEVIRAEGSMGNANEVSIGTTQDTVIVDVSNLNTESRTYNYRIRAVDSDGKFVGESPSASTIRLEALSSVNSIELNWDAVVPWSIQLADFPDHRIFRDNVVTDPSTLVHIASANVATDGLVYLDDGGFNGVPLSDQIEYCYYVETKGSYGNAQIIEPLINKSQIICAQPNDEIPPCAPLNFRIDNPFSCEELLANSTCIFDNYSNRLAWELDEGDECQDDVRSFNIYFSEDGSDNYELVSNVTDLQFNHSNLNSFKGCYKVTAVDRSQNETPLDQATTICNDNCPNFRMPNAFSPNGDSWNQVLTEMIDNIDGVRIESFNFANCPRFVRGVNFKVFDRNGAEVFSSGSGNGFGETGSPFIRWDGKSNGGVELPAGLYYYSADVTFDVLDADLRLQNFHGWIHLLK